MMKKITFAVVLSAFLAVTFLSTSCSVFKSSSRRRVKTLLVTGNFFEPRLLCELTQYYSKQPLMLFQPAAADSTAAPQIFYLTSNGQSEEISAEQFMDFLGLLNPKQIIVVGGPECVPEKFVSQASEQYSVICLRSQDWNRTAQSLNKLLKLDRLPQEFEDTRARYKEAGILN